MRCQSSCDTQKRTGPCTHRSLESKTAHPKTDGVWLFQLNSFYSLFIVVSIWWSWRTCSYRGTYTSASKSWTEFYPEWAKLFKTLLLNGTQKVHLVNTLFYPLSLGSWYCWSQDTEQGGGGSLFWPALAFLTSWRYVVLICRHCLLSQWPMVGLESFVFHASIRISFFF